MSLTIDDVLALANVRADVHAGRVRAVRENAGLSQAELAAVVDVSPSAIAQWEAGRRTPRGPAALRYARALSHLGADSRDSTAA